MSRILLASGGTWKRPQDIATTITTGGGGGEAAEAAEAAEAGGGGGTTGKTIFGFNVLPQDQTMLASVRHQWFGRIPCGRGYYSPGDFPSANANLANNWTSGKEWQVAGAQWNEKRINICVKFPGDSQPADVKNGKHDAEIINYLEQIPSGWTVYFTFYHEYNGHIDNSTPGTDFPPAFIRIGQLIDDHANGRAKLDICINGLRNSPWDMSWCPSASDLPTGSIVTFDAYSNPSGGSGGVKGYGTMYPAVSTVIDPCYEVVSTKGFDKAGYGWGIGEFNAPRRMSPSPNTLYTSPYNDKFACGPNSPHDVDGSGMAANITQYVNYCLNKPKVPELILLWEGDGNLWNQRFNTGGSFDGDDQGKDPKTGKQVYGNMYQNWPVNTDITKPVAAYKAFVDVSL